MKFCTYKVSHPVSKRYYFGKGKLHLVESGKYKGSGRAIRDAFTKHPKEEWIAEIIKVFEDEMEAYHHEAKLVTQEILDDPLCLNLQLGGRDGISKPTPETRLRMSEAQKKRPPVKDETREKLRLKGLGQKRPKSEEHRKKIGDGNRGKVRTEEFKTAKSEQMKNFVKLHPEKLAKATAAAAIWSDERRQRQSTRCTGRKLNKVTRKWEYPNK